MRNRLAMAIRSAVSRSFQILKYLIFLVLFLHACFPEFQSECDDETTEETHEDGDTKHQPDNQTNSHNSTDGEDASPNLQQTESLMELTGSPTSSSNYSMNAQDEGATDTIIDIDKLSSKSKENDATLVKLGEMLSKYLGDELRKDLTQDADQKKNCQLIRFCLDPNQELQETKSEFGVYFGRFILKWGKEPEIIRSMQEAKGFVGDMNLTHKKSYTLTRNLFFYAFFINIFLLQWDKCDSTFRTRYDAVKDDLVAFNNQIPFAILKKVHGWIADTWKAENPIPDLTDLILKCLLDQNWSASLTGKSGDVSHLLELFYKAYTEIWGTTKNCDNDVGDTGKKRGFPCAKQLKETGVKFDVKYTNDLLDISFERGTLKIPFLITDQRFLSILRNLVLYEKLVGVKKPVTSLVCFLTCLIQTEDDIRILHNARIKEKAWYELPRILSDICASAGLNYQYHQLSGISYEIDQFYLKKMNRWYHGCYKNYCYDPNAIMLSVLGAVAYLFYIFNGAVNVDHWFHGKNHSP